MSCETLEQAVDDGILTITLHRPEQLNAFTVTMADELEAAFRTVNDDDSVRAVIVTNIGANTLDAGESFVVSINYGEADVLDVDALNNIDNVNVLTDGTAMST
ncbi:enoyl-CoA hydratase-related protein [Flexivirga sp. B27]